MDLALTVQPTLQDLVRVILRDNPGDLDVIFECRIALALALHPEIGSLGIRYIAAHAGIATRTAWTCLPQTGQTSPHGLIHCYDRGRNCHDEQGQTPGRYSVSHQIDVSGCDEFADPGREIWIDHRSWTLAVLYGPQEVTVGIPELVGMLGTRKLVWLAVNRLEGADLAIRTGRGVVLLQLDHATTAYSNDCERTDRRDGRLNGIVGEAIRSWSRLREKIRARWRAATEKLVAGRLALARWLGNHEVTVQDLLRLPDHLLPEHDRTSWHEARVLTRNS